MELLHQLEDNRSLYEVKKLMKGGKGTLTYSEIGTAEQMLAHNSEKKSEAEDLVKFHTRNAELGFASSFNEQVIKFGQLKDAQAQYPIIPYSVGFVRNLKNGLKFELQLAINAKAEVDGKLRQKVEECELLREELDNFKQVAHTDLKALIALQ